MPIYEYQCRACEHRLEKLQKISDPPLVTCPECGRDTLTKLISAAGFRLKGGGWYETDFKSKGKRNLAEDGKSDSAAKSGSSDKPDAAGSNSGDAKAKKTSAGTDSTKSAASAA